MNQKRIVSCLAAFMLVAGMVAAPLGKSEAKLAVTEISASAAIYGDFKYSTEDYQYSDGTIKKDSASIDVYIGSDSEVTIPSSIDGYPVREISYNAFDGCTSITKLTIPSSIVGVYANTFSACTNLKDIYYSSTIEQWNTITGYDSGNNLTSVTIHCTDGTLMKQPSSNYEFFEYYITQQKINNKNQDYATICKYRPSEYEGGSSESDSSSNDSASINEVIVPSYIDGCPVTIVSGGAFDSCSNLTSIILPDNLISIGMGAFSRCNALTSITLPDNLLSIGYEAFYYCNNLKTVNMPNSITDIGENAFGGCQKLVEINFNGTKEEWNSINKIRNDFSGAMIYCTDGSFASQYYDSSASDYYSSAYDSSSYNTSSTSSSSSRGDTSNSITDTSSSGKPSTSSSKTDSSSKNNSSSNKGSSSSSSKPDSSSSAPAAVTKTSLKNATVKLSKTAAAYTGKPFKPSVTVKVGSTTLKKGTDYTVSYKNYTNAGTATVTVTGKGKYTGSVSKTYKITKASVSKAAVSVASKAYTGKSLKPAPVVKLNGTKLKKGTDYTVTYKNNKKVGKATVTIKGKGNYTGTVKKTFIIKPKKTTVKKLTSPKTKTVKLTWKKDPQVDGYKVQIALDKKFTKSAKTYTVKKATTVSKTVTKLKKGKTYYARVCGYKKIGSKNYKSAWSKIVKVKCK